MSSVLDRLPATFTYTQAMSAGLNQYQLYALRDAGDLEQIGRGLYQKADAELADRDLLEAAHRAPNATICLLSALARHELTDAIPAKHDLALPRDAWHPRIGAAVSWHSFDRDTFMIGRTTIPVDAATTIGVYDAPRTIVDTYRLRNTLGADTAHEALRRWISSGGQPGLLLKTATKFPRARPVILNALEILL